MNKITSFVGDEISRTVLGLTSKGFVKAFFWSFGSFLLLWATTALTLPEVNQVLSQYGWLVPLLNTVLVALKQIVDEHKN